MDHILDPKPGDILVCYSTDDSPYDEEYCIFLGYDEEGDASIFSLDEAKTDFHMRPFYTIDSEENSQYYCWRYL
jgi:hypothetical protein